MRISAGDKSVVSFRNAAILAASIVLGHAALAVGLATDSPLRVVLNDVLFPIASGLAAACLFYAARQAKGSDRIVRGAWVVLATAQLFNALAEVVWAIIELGFHERPFPSLADGLYLMYYPLFAIGLLRLAAASRAPGERLKQLIDMGIIMIAATLVSGAFLIAPMMAVGEQDPLTLALSVCYPILDLVLFFALIELLFSRLHWSGQGPLALLALSVTMLIVSDTAFSFQSLQGTYVTGNLVDTGYLVSCALTGLAGILLATTRSAALPLASHPAEPWYRQFRWTFYLPFSWMIAAYCLLAWSHEHPLPISFSALAWGVGVIGGLVLLRQILIIQENARLFTAAQKEIAERKLAEERVEAALEEKEVLLKEIHHRVKNNLQLISSLLSLQSASNPSQQVITAFQDSQSRIDSIALVHKKLYSSEDFAQVDLNDYIHDLAASLFSVYGADAEGTQLQVDVEDVSIGIDVAIPLGLIINELISNCLKHAFPRSSNGPAGLKDRVLARRSGVIHLSLNGPVGDAGLYVLIVGDNGVGFPQDLDFHHTTSLGLQLVTTLVKQLGGAIELQRAGGTEFKISFPAAKHERRQ